MFNMKRKQKAILGDITIALLMLVLAFMLKDADTENKTTGFFIIMAAVFIRLNGLKFIGVNSKNNTKCD